MSVKARSYIELAKHKPGLLVHLGLFGVMCYLNWGVYESLSSVLPESAKLGHRAIIAESVTVFIVILMIVRATPKVVEKALILIVAATVVTVFNFGVHWFYSRDIAMSNQYATARNTQRKVDSGLADDQAKRVEGVAKVLTDYNNSQASLSKADRDYYRTTGVKRNRAVQNAPDLTSFVGVTATPSPTPENAAKVEEVVHLRPEDVPAKYSDWFLLGAVVGLAVVFVGAAYLAASWEWDVNGNGMADNLEIEPGKV